jgi:DNA polymerase-3 subunit chi
MAATQPEIWFYHLETIPLVQALPDLLEKVAGRGWRAYVHCPEGESSHEDDKIDALDRQLWSYAPASFLAHGREDEAFAERQPVLLGRTGGMANTPQVYVSAGAGNVPELGGLERALIVFEGSDEAHLGWARAQWKRMKSEGLALAYWKQSPQGRWEKVQ